METLLNTIHFAFNVWDFESARAVIDAAKDSRCGVVLQTSTGIYKQLPARVFSEFVKKYAAYSGVDVWLNLDHCKEKETLMDAVDNGWDMIMADGSSLPIEKNIGFTNEIAQYAHEKGTYVEGEVGRLMGNEDDISERKMAVATRADIDRFLSEAKIDLIAVAFGNAHGEYKVKPDLRYDLVEYTTAASSKGFVVHGASDMPEGAVEKLISIPGVKKINVSTDLKKAYRRGIKRASEKKDQPVDLAKMIRIEMMKTVNEKMKMLNRKGEAK